MTAPRRLRALLFDLDGTLIDSAPDLAGAANDMRVARGLVPFPLEHFRPMVGAGARGMMARAFDLGPQDDAFSAMRDEFLQRYEARMTRETRVFPHVQTALAVLATRRVRWGIVTNKAARFAEPLVQALRLIPPGAALVCGDTTPHSKPHPAPLLEAARLLELDPAECAYVGDDLRDVEAGRAAGMTTVAVRWGYLGLGPSVDTWGADHIASIPDDLLTLLPMP